MKIIASFLILLSFHTVSFSQERSRFGISLFGGYRINTGGINVFYNLSPRTSFYTEFGVDKYHGAGIAIGLTENILKFNNFRTFVGLNYERTFGGKIGIGLNSNPTIFKISDANFLLPYIGIKYIDIINKNHYQNFFSYFIRVGSKFSTQTHPSVIYVSGPTSNTNFPKAERYIQNGIIASIGLTINIVKNVR